MKKLVIILVFLAGSFAFWVFSVFSATSVIVTATVGNLNSSPTILRINPTSDPRILGKNKLQNYTLYFKDNEKDTISSYTITPASGASNILNGTINTSDYDTASGAYINFTYLSPSSIPTPNPTTITITLDDGTNFVTKDLHVYVY